MCSERKIYYVKLLFSNQTYIILINKQMRLENNYSEVKSVRGKPVCKTTQSLDQLNFTQESMGERRRSKNGICKDLKQRRQPAKRESARELER
jgi:hypothetical protein